MDWRELSQKESRSQNKPILNAYKENKNQTLVISLLLKCVLMYRKFKC